MFWIYFLAVIVLVFGFVVFRGAPYVPSQRKYIYQAFSKLYPISKNDFLLDVGSGDGVVLRIASKLGAKVVGYELNPLLVCISRLLSLHDNKVRVKLADFWLTQIPDDTTIIYVFAVTRDIKKMISKIQFESNRLNRKISVLSYGNEFKGIKYKNKLQAYYLYEFRPLHQDKAQV